MEKDVAAINTGNIAAFVKQGVSAKFNVTKESLETINDTAKIPGGANATENFVELSTAYSANTDALGVTTAVGDEVTSIEAGSVVAWSSNTADIRRIAVQAKDNSANNIGDAPGTNFTPTADNVYIFRREIKDASNTGTKTFEYVGYYYTGSKYYKIGNIVPQAVKATDKVYEADKKAVTADAVGEDSGYIGEKYDANGILYAAPTYQYAVETTTVSDAVLSYDGTNNYIIAADSVDAIIRAKTLATAQKVVDDAGADVTDEQKTTLETAKAAAKNDIVVYVNLTNNGTGTGKWTPALETAGVATDLIQNFYYNNILAPGSTSAKLIDSVTLSFAIQSGAFKDLDFDLNVKVDSAQVVYDDGQTTVLTTAIDNDIITWVYKATGTGNNNAISSDADVLTWSTR